MALTGEYSPTRAQVTLMMLASADFILAGALSGALAALLISWLSWRSIFGAIGPAALALAALLALQGSLRFLAARVDPDDMVFHDGKKFDADDERARPAVA